MKIERGHAVKLDRAGTRGVAVEPRRHARFFDQQIGFALSQTAQLRRPPPQPGFNQIGFALHFSAPAGAPYNPDNLSRNLT
jgi:hypothetical protein